MGVGQGALSFPVSAILLQCPFFSRWREHVSSSSSPDHHPSLLPIGTCRGFSGGVVASGLGLNEVGRVQLIRELMKDKNWLISLLMKIYLCELQNHIHQRPGCMTSLQYDTRVVGPRLLSLYSLRHVNRVRPPELFGWSEIACKQSVQHYAEGGIKGWIKMARQMVGHS